MPVNKATVDTAEETKIIKAEMNSQWKKGYHCFMWNFQSIISLHMLKLALNKSMRASDNEQGINKLQPY